MVTNSKIRDGGSKDDAGWEDDDSRPDMTYEDPKQTVLASLSLYHIRK